MSESMVERVAKAIHKSRQERGFSGAAAWEYEPDQIHDLFRHSARAAIEAMRRPTGEMAIAGRRTSLYPARTFAAMIDAALTPDEAG